MIPTGTAHVLDLLGNTIAALQQRVAELETALTEAVKAAAPQSDTEEQP
jgi:BMFP domain-containing protein YqiC